MLLQTARPGATATPPPPSNCFQAGLVFRPTGFFTIPAGAADNSPRNRFSPTPEGGFCTPQADSSFAASIKVAPTVPVETSNEDRPLTSSALLPRPVLGGEPCGGCLRPWFMARPHVNNLVLQHHCTLCTVLVYKPLYIR
jgi:hypothetical protein